jgi:hypothetical protein
MVIYCVIVSHSILMSIGTVGVRHLVLRTFLRRVASIGTRNGSIVPNLAGTILGISTNFGSNTNMRCLPN